MANTHNMEVTLTENSRIDQFDFDNISFGTMYADHQFSADYVNGAWGNLKIMPFGDMPMSPGLAAIHYGQAIFEGMKAYKNATGEILLFRPLDNLERLNVSAARLAMATIPAEIFMQGLIELLKVDAAWVPDRPDTSLYLRPFMFASDNFLGVRASLTYKFMIINSPAGKYYSNPPRVKIETEFVRAAPGGVGYVKAAGNYAASLHPTQLAQAQGYDQLLWTDALTHEYFEESGTMNTMFIINGKLVTPTTSETILKGITRDSIVKIAKHWKIEVEERRVSVKEIVEGIQSGAVTEAFGAGTAVVVSAFSAIGYNGTDLKLPVQTNESFATRVKNFLDDLRSGKIADPFGWIVKVA